MRRIRIPFSARNAHPQFLCTHFGTVISVNSSCSLVLIHPITLPEIPDLDSHLTLSEPYNKNLGLLNKAPGAVSSVSWICTNKGKETIFMDTHRSERHWIETVHELLVKDRSPVTCLDFLGKNVIVVSSLPHTSS